MTPGGATPAGPWSDDLRPTAEPFRTLYDELRRDYPDLTEAEVIAELVRSQRYEPSPNTLANGHRSAVRPFTDDGNAYRLVDEHGEDLTFVPGLGWFVWTGVCWASDSDGEVTRRARAITQQLRDEARELRERDPDSALTKAATQHAARSGSRRSVEAMGALGRSDRRVIVAPDVLDADPWLLVCTNGTIDLRTGKLRENARADHATHHVPLAFVPGASAPRWRAFLDRIFAGDDELIDYVHRMAGAALVGQGGEQVMHVLYGGGANGKTTFVETIRHALGTYAAHTATDTLLADRRTGSPAPELLHLRGRRLVTASESAEGRRLDEALVKTLTGGDTISARFLFSNEIVSFTPRFALWLATNHRPEVRERSEAIWRRLRIVPFTVTIPEGERDGGLGERLRVEEGQGILEWLVEGCLKWQARGLERAARVTAATAAYREEEDVLGAFLAERCVTGDDETTASSPLFAAWQEYAKEAGTSAFETMTAFGRALTDAGYPAGKTGGTRVRRRLRLRGTLDDEASGGWTG